MLINPNPQRNQFSMMKKARIDAAAAGDHNLIHKLPDHLLHRILFYLSLKDLVRTSVLSKIWRYLWISALPTLQFNGSFFKFESSQKSQDEISSKREDLINFIEKTLQIRHSQKVNIDTLLLHIPFYSSTMAISLDRCLTHAIECDAKKLDFCIKFEKGISYNLPQTVYVARSLTSLSLCGCTMKSSSSTNMELSCLEKLFLENVLVNSQMIQNLIANCPVIRVLSINYRRRFKGEDDGTLKILAHSNPRLHRLVINWCSFKRIEIESLSLRTFHFHQEPTLSPSKLNLLNCKNLRSLHLEHPTITDSWIHGLLSKLCLLERLSLTNCNMLESVKISSSRLKTLTVFCCINLVKLEVDDPNLKKFTFFGYNVISYSSNALALLWTYIGLLSSDIDTQWYVKLTKFLGNFNNSNILCLSGESSKTVIVPKELRESLVSPLYNVQHMNLVLDQDLSSQEVEEAMYDLLWLSPHPATLSINSLLNNKIMKKFCMQFQYKEEIDKEENCSCSSLPISCWRHCLKEVGIRNIGWDEDIERNLNNIFRGHAKIL